MYNTDLLKQTFERGNVTEQKVLCNLIDNYPDLTIIRGKDIVSVDWCAKQLKGQNVLIIDAKNPNITEKGRHRVTEFCFIHTTGKKIWIDAKQQRSTSNITDAVYGDMNRAVKCKDEFWYVCEGAGYSDEVVKQFNTYIKKNDLNIKAFDISLLTTRLLIN